MVLRWENLTNKPKGEEQTMNKFDGLIITGISIVFIAMGFLSIIAQFNI
jgi:hypothetical protein